MTVSFLGSFCLYQGKCIVMVTVSLFFSMKYWIISVFSHQYCQYMSYILIQWKNNRVMCKNTKMIMISLTSCEVVYGQYENITLTWHIFWLYKTYFKYLFLLLQHKIWLKISISAKRFQNILNNKKIISKLSRSHF